MKQTFGEAINPLLRSRCRLLLVDDHMMVRKALAILLRADPNMNLIGECRDGRSAVELARALLPDVVLMDLRLPELNGIDATRRITQGNLRIKIIALSSASDSQSVIQMLRAGARGYVRKESAFEELTIAIEAVMSGRIFLTGSLDKRWVENARQPDGDPASVFGILTTREREVMQLLAEGKAIKEVARSMQVSLKTAETQRRNLMAKMGFAGVVDLIKYAIRQGLTGL